MHWEHNKVVGIGSSSAGGACTDEPANLEKSLGEQLRVRGFDPVLWAVPSFLVPASLLARACAILAALFLFLFTSGFDFCGEDFSEGSLRARFDPCKTTTIGVPCRIGRLKLPGSRTSRFCVFIIS